MFLTLIVILIYYIVMNRCDTDRTEELARNAGILYFTDDEAD